MTADLGLRSHRRLPTEAAGQYARQARKLSGAYCSINPSALHPLRSGRGERSPWCVHAQPSSGAEGTTSVAQSLKPYPYNDSDGKKQKATIEHIFPALESGTASPQQQQPQPSSDRPAAPWQLGWQMNERNLYWNDELKVRLIKRIASDELGISDQDMDERLQQLGALLPGLQSRMARAPPKLVAAGGQHGEVAQRLLRLKITFPQANLSTMVNNRLGLLLDDDLGAVEAAAVRLRKLLPGINVDRFVETFPLVLDVECFERALEDARRILPGTDVTAMLRSNPEVILSLVKGKNLIPYDQISNPWA